MTNQKPTQVVTGEVRISYEHLLRPYANNPKKDAKYSATLLIPKGDAGTKQRLDAAIEAAKLEGIAKKWNGVAPPIVAIPLHDGDGVRPSDGMPFGEECRGYWVMSASSKHKQDIVDLGMNPIIDATQVYSGIYAKVSINFFPYFSEGKKGIGCGLGPIQKTRDGEPLGGKVSANDVFAAQQQYAQQAPTPAAGYGQPAPGYQQAQPQPSAYGQPPAAPAALPQAYGQPASGYQQAPPAPAQPQPVHPVTGQPVGNVMGL